MMNTDLSGKHALIGGASKGIGKAVAYELASLGADVTLLARSEALLDELLQQLPDNGDQHHSYAVVDFDELNQLKDLLNRLTSNTRFHIVLNNSGGPAGGPIVDADIQEFSSAFQRHILASHLIMQATLPGMIEAHYGRFINIISTSVKEPIPGLGVSNTIRGAMGNWAKTLASEVGKYGITVNNVLPGYTGTDRLKNIIANRASGQNITEEQVAQAMKSNVPFGRFAEPPEIAVVVAFLASPAASYINGINVPVDGGRTKSL